MSQPKTSRLGAIATAASIAGLILAMGAPVKWGFFIPWPFM
jgi:hypothetical protein